MSAPPLLSSATHVVCESFVADRLSALGAANIVLAKDSLLVGPSHHDLMTHERMRRAWWGVPDDESVDSIASSLVKWSPPIVVWIAPQLGDRLNLWRTCKRLRELRIAAANVRVIEVEPVPPKRPREGPRPPFECGASVAHHSDDALLRHLARARPLSGKRLARLVNLWDRFTSSDPRPFVRACLRGVEGVPELASLWAFLSCFLPRRTRGDGLHLSRFDQLLLSVLGDAPRTPLAVFVHKSAAGEELRALGSCTGDLFFPRRLQQWAQHGPAPALERTAGPTADNPMKAFAYRITDRGRRLLDAGLEDLTDAPDLPLAGITAYRGSDPWVLQDERCLVRLGS